jgi:ubiquinone/menaquinone biosynthesis C-methylase UbiE
MPGIIVDLGTGDGEFVSTLARANPDRFIIGLDPNQQGLENTSAKIYKKPGKGGLKNALFVLGSIESLPEELDGLANQIYINFPWAGLLKGLLLADAVVWNAIKRVCKPGALIDILFSYEKTAEENEFAKAGLPDIDLEYLQGITAPWIEKLGFKIIELKNVGAEEIKRYPSTWAKKLSFGRDRKYYYLRVKTY